MFIYNGKEKKVEHAVNLANEDELKKDVAYKILNEREFDMCNANSVYLSVSYIDFLNDIDIDVEVYRPVWRWSKAYGYFTRSKPTTVHINYYKMRSMYVARIVSLLYHEAGHMLDHWDEVYSFNHGSNSPVGKEKTFQYSLNRYVNDYFNIPPKKRRPSVWQRIKNYLKFRF